MLLIASCLYQRFHCDAAKYVKYTNFIFPTLDKWNMFRTHPEYELWTDLFHL